MSKKLRFESYAEPRACYVCGSMLGRLMEESEEGEGLGIVQEGFCPSPYCATDRTKPENFDASFLYRTRVLVFTKAKGAETHEDDRDVVRQDAGEEGAGEEGAGEEDTVQEIGVIRAIKPEEVHDPVSRRNAPIVVENVCWPRDRKRFCELFNRHVHHEMAPNITVLNDGWDSSQPLPVL